MRSSTTNIIHVAWTVNYNYNLNMLEPNIQGLRHLIDFALSSPLPSPPRLAFTSSIAVLRRKSKVLKIVQASNCTTEHAGNREFMGETFSDASLALGSGYSESKWVAESVLQSAASQTPLRPIVLRIGQISGGINGCWNPMEWLPAMILSAKNVGCLPDSVQVSNCFVVYPVSFPDSFPSDNLVDTLRNCSCFHRRIA